MITWTNKFQGPLKSEGMVTNGNDLDMELENVSDGEERTTTINSHKWQRSHHKHEAREPPFGIDIVSQLWLCFPIHKAIVMERGKMPVKERKKLTMSVWEHHKRSRQTLHPPICFPMSHPKALPQRETGCDAWPISTLHSSTTPWEGQLGDGFL